MVDQKELVSKASKGLIRDYNLSIPVSKGKQGSYEVYPEFDRETALNDIRNDDTVKASVITLTDKSLEYGYTISSVDNKSNLEEFNKFAKKVRLDKIIEKVFSNLYAYQNCFVENVKDGNDKAKEVHMLETTQTQPETTENGEITGYIQKVTGFEANDYPTWDVDEVTHITIDSLSESVWSDISIQAIHKYVLLKEYIYTYYGWFFGTNQKRKLLNIKDANDDSVKDLLSYMKKMENDITKHIPFSGELEKIELGDINDADKALSLIDKCDSNILKLLQVPAIAANETGDSNRSSGDSQDGHLATRIKKVHRVVEEAFINDLFVKLGFPKIIIKFNSPVKANIDKILQNAERMKNIGFKINVIEEYLHGENFPVEGKLIDKKIFEVGTSKSEDMFDSRQRKGEGDSSENIGTGEESTTREDQLVAKASKGLTFLYKKEDEGKFNKYPYVM